MPPLQTAFVAQSFCPAWRAAHTYPLQLTAGLLQALATQVRCWQAVHYKRPAACLVARCSYSCKDRFSWHYSQLISTLAHCCATPSQSVRVEVWHRCPRAAGGRAQREVLLGTGSARLLDVLRHPQVRCKAWVGRRGSAA